MKKVFLLGSLVWTSVWLTWAVTNGGPIWSVVIQAVGLGASWIACLALLELS